MSDALAYLAVANLLAAATVLVVLVLRRPVRRMFGAPVAYALWSLVPAAALALLLPARVERIAAPVLIDQAAVASVDAAGPLAAPAAPDLPPLIAALWIAGIVASLAWLAWRQAQFAVAVREGRGGPAVVGVLRPRVVTPDDFARRYTERERQVVLAHEEAHIRRHDSRINAVVALARCVNWFNPLLHLAAHVMRIDQELACDAQVVAAHPHARRAYAEAMVKTQLAARPLPLGCYWPAQSAHPLAERVRLLGRPTPGRSRRLLGCAVVALLGLLAAGSAWAVRPARMEVTPSPAAAPRLAAAPAPIPRAVGASRPQPRPAKLAVEAAALSPPAVAVADDVVADAAPLPAPAPDTAPAPTARKITAAARRSSVEPGSAVRLVATTVDPEGNQLINDITAFGSQSAYRTGYYRLNGSRQSLFTGVVQRGDRIWVTASLNREFDRPVTGTIALRSGETGDIVLDNGQVVTVTPTVRAETPEEVAQGERAARQMETAREAARRARERSRVVWLAGDPPY
jgi:beta-lactamase regulating signal transducer with metallopeptidase domain